MEFKDIIPFKGIYFNEKKIKNLDKVFCPIYDLISSEREKFYKKASKYNVINLILRKPPTHNEYKKARELVKEWLDKNILIKEKEDKIYPLEIEYSKKRLKGFFALLNVKPFKTKIYAHEKTHTFPIKDRFLLLKSTQFNFCSIFLASLNKNLIIKDFFEKNIKKFDRILCVQDNFKNKFKLFSLKVDSTVEDFLFSLKEFLIADGHHRFKVALNYADYLNKKNSEFSKSAQYILAFFTDFFQEGLYLGTFHRIIRLNLKDEDFFKRLENYFKIKKMSSVKKFLNNSRNQNSLKIGLVTANKKCILEPTERIRKKEFKDFEVLFLHEFLFKKVLNLNLKEQDIIYTPSAEEAISKIDSHTKSFLLRPFKKEKVLKIVKRNKLFPQKSTYFYPKLLTGLVMRDLRDGII